MAYSYFLTLEIKKILKGRSKELKPAKQKRLNRLMKYQLRAHGAFKLAKLLG